jgi:aspartyl-tRNA(Asn)/glutamyl-tRNA(Gln) amidotransferase subunit B
LSASGLEISRVKIQPQDLVALIDLVNSNTVHQPGAKKIFSVMFETGRPPQEIMAELGLQQISDAGQLAAIVRQVIAEHPDPVEQFKAGKDKTIMFLVGQVMRASRGKANPQLAEQILRDQLQQ